MQESCIQKLKRAGRHAPLLVGVGALTAAAVGAAAPGLDAAKVQGAETCKECHAASYTAWEQSTHYATFKEQHRSEAAKAILGKLGLSSMKRNDLCVQCHYTPQMVDGTARPVSGVSCESCHGPGQGWTGEQLHHEAASKAGSPEARESILLACEKAGMLRPRNVAGVARNCYQCHTVPNEKLVNVGGHPAGSDFELVSWSQGEVRHNYQYSDDKGNRAASAERRRILFVVGVVTDLEFALRGLGKATEKGPYRSAMAERVKKGAARVDAVLGRASIPVLASTMAGLRNEKGNLKRAALAEGPDQLRAAADAIATEMDGSALASLDEIIPTKSMGTAQP